MQARLLIINCPSEYFFYIPMGTFGLCDYLTRKNITVKILNLAIYEDPGTYRVLEHYIDLFQPTHVGIIFHWQETAEGFLRVGEWIKSHNEDLQIIGGGFTAGYFGEDLLEKCRFLDFAIKGDPERPMELLLNGDRPSVVPNLIYRSTCGIRSNEVSYLIDNETLSGISFSGLTHLYDYELYIDAMDKKLGFPLFIGRGCTHGCRYCGGSCTAFRLHSARATPVKRSIDSVVEDLKRLRHFTRKIYLCYENDRDYIKSLFSVMKTEEALVKTFHLNYGAWQLIDRDFLELYKELFITLGNIKPVIELSPEVFDDEARRRIKNGSVYYSIGEMKENLNLINSHLGDKINISIFFSRHHETVKTYAGVKREISGILRFKHDLLSENIINAKVFYDHLSTDVASRYWEDHMKRPKNFGTLISAGQKLKMMQEQLGFPVNNFCIYVPDTLTEKETLRCESLIFILETFENYFYEMLHILFKCMGVQTVDVFEDIVRERCAEKTANVPASLDHQELLCFLRRKITGDTSLLAKVPFIEDLINLNMKKSGAKQSANNPGDSPHSAKQILNYELISVHEHDYLDLALFLKRLDNKGFKHLKPEKTVYIFLVDEILSMTYETFRSTLREFDKGIFVDDYCELMEKKGIFTRAYHNELINKLFRSSVLIPASSGNVQP